MKLVEWVNNHRNKNVVIITKTEDQASYIYHQIRLSVMCLAATERSKIKMFNGNTIMVVPEYMSQCKFKGMTIDVLLFCNVGQNTRNTIKQYLLPSIRISEGIIGELAT